MDSMKVIWDTVLDTLIARKADAFVRGQWRSIEMEMSRDKCAAWMAISVRNVAVMSESGDQVLAL